MKLKKSILGGKIPDLPEKGINYAPVVDSPSKKVIYVASDRDEYLLVHNNIRDKEKVSFFMDPSEAYLVALSYKGEVEFIASASSSNTAVLIYATQLARQKKDAKVTVMIERGIAFNAPGVEVTKRLNPGEVLRRAGVDSPDIEIVPKFSQSLIDFVKKRATKVYIISSNPSQQLDNIPHEELVSKISMFKGKDVLIYGEATQEVIYQLRRVARCVKVCINSSEVIENLKKDDNWLVLIGEDKIN